MISCASRQDNIGSRMIFPDEWGVNPESTDTTGTSTDTDTDTTGSSNIGTDIPSVFIVNVQVK